MTQKDFVFLDRKGNRWPRARLALLISALLLLVTAIAFLQALLINPELRLPPALRDLKTQLRATPPNTQRPLLSQSTEPWLPFARPPGALPRPAASSSKSEIHAAIYVRWDPASMESLKKDSTKLTHVCPEIFNVDGYPAKLRFEADPDLLRFLSATRLALVPLLTNTGPQGWENDAVEGLIRSDSSVQEHFADELVKDLLSIQARGVLLDWQEIDPQYKADLTSFLQFLAGRLHASNLQLWLSVPLGDGLHVFDLDSLASFTDYFVAQLHDENSERDNPGPIASRPWFEGWLRVIMGYGKPEQWILGLGTYGYDWTAGKKEARSLAFADAMGRADDAKVGPVKSEAPLYNPGFTYLTNGEEHTVWFLDASTFLNQWNAARREGCAGILLDRLGSEDPLLWKALESLPPKNLSLRDLAFLEPLRGTDAISHLGEGDFVEADLSSEPGRREVSLGKDGQVAVTYTKFPQYPTLYHTGRGQEDEVALTFDDGPNPEFTPQILDILKLYKIHAAFFLLGNQAEKYPGLVRRILAEGHEIGSHTYTHPNLGTISREQIILELNATQRLLEWITGHSTLLFRPPYNADAQPRNLDEIRPMLVAQNQGYLTVCESIDPEDWARPGADAIYQRVKQLRSSGNIILLHDAGGDRTQTVAALPKILDYLLARGDKIVSLSTLVGTPREVLMPSVSVNESSMSRVVSSFGLMALHGLEEFIWAFMVLATVLTLLRTLAVIVLALIHHRREKQMLARVPDSTEYPPLSIVIAAYNEEKVLQSTLASVFATDYKGEIEVVVVDDGSKDATSLQAAEYGKNEPRLKLLSQSNQGKARALSNGIEAALHDLIVFIDADTQFQRDTLTVLVRPLSDPKTGAVSGHARVGNLKTWIARFQSLEYVCGFNLDRRAYDILNAITVAPGAISVFRRQAIRQAGGIHTNTLAEDTDLTLALHRAGWRIRYASGAKAWTEAPESIRTLAKQRFRWAFGTMQCLWKHRDLVLNSRFGGLAWFSLPSIWIFQIVLVAAVPVVDLLLVLSLVAGTGMALIVYFFVFLLTDLMLAFLACVLEEEPWTRAFYILPMRFLYRPILSYVVWRSILHSLKGAWVGWGKLERQGNVTLPPATTGN